MKNVSVTLLTAIALLIVSCVGQKGKTSPQENTGKPTTNLDIEDKRWEIIELNGEEVKGSAKTHYLIFHSESGQLEVKANCNTISNPYKITDQSKITISDGLSTLMGCPDNLEDDLLKALKAADNFTKSGNYLSIKQGELKTLIRLKSAKY